VPPELAVATAEIEFNAASHAQDSPRTSPRTPSKRPRLSSNLQGGGGGGGAPEVHAACVTAHLASHVRPFRSVGGGFLPSVREHHMQVALGVKGRGYTDVDAASGAQDVESSDRCC
jgi:hypothetical protein